MKGLILAAGDGGRLRPLTLKTPKVLLNAGGDPLIHYPIKALQLAGVTEIAVVLGHNAAKVEEAVGNAYPEIKFLYNENHSGGNALSIGVARDFMGASPFVVCMGDHPISPKIVASLLSHPVDGNTLCVDPDARLPAQLNDGTRVLVGEDGYIDGIGKGLKDWSAIDTGVFKMTSEVFSVIDILTDRLGTAVGISDVVRHFGVMGRPFSTCDVGGAFWSDVDTLDDYVAIESILGSV
jgi:CDP-L-myo-inositol myo-inositolphosphotransferase